MKIDKIKQLIIIDEEHEVSWGDRNCCCPICFMCCESMKTTWCMSVCFKDISPDDLGEQLPERQPRYPFTSLSWLCIKRWRQSSWPGVFASLTRPTFIAYSYKYTHDDGRVSYPLCFIFSSPVGKETVSPAANATYDWCSSSLFWRHVCFCPGCQPGLQMMYAGSKNKLVQSINMTKVSHPLCLLFVVCT